MGQAPLDLQQPATDEEAKQLFEQTRPKKYVEGHVLAPGYDYEDFIPHYVRTPIGLQDKEQLENQNELRIKGFRNENLNLSGRLPDDMKPSEEEAATFAAAIIPVKEPVYTRESALDKAGPQPGFQFTFPVEEKFGKEFALHGVSPLTRTIEPSKKKPEAEVKSGSEEEADEIVKSLEETSKQD
jgi:hypothetical protein